VSFNKIAYTEPCADFICIDFMICIMFIICIITAMIVHDTPCRREIADQIAAATTLTPPNRRIPALCAVAFTAFTAASTEVGFRLEVLITEPEFGYGIGAGIIFLLNRYA
jgi:hypothetical protein